MEKKSLFTVRNIALVGVLAAMVFALTKFISIPIPSPLGKTALSVGNAMCLLSAMLFGPGIGGLAAGIGNALVDLSDPAWAPEFWITFINKFLMAFICGLVMHKVRLGSEKVRVWVAGLCGALTYSLLYITKSVAVLMIAGSAFLPALEGNITKVVATLINAVFAVAVSNLLALTLRGRLEKTGLLQKIHV